LGVDRRGEKQKQQSCQYRKSEVHDGKKD
jgi:hypothetical protein